MLPYFDFHFLGLTVVGQVNSWEDMLGQKLKELRESKGLVQRQIAAELEVDTAYISKLENNEKPFSRNHLKKLSELFNYSEDELIAFWLADKLFSVVKDERLGLRSLEIAQKYLVDHSSSLK
jgi:transcriptional regulator with XRE-family HTH domain